MKLQDLWNRMDKLSDNDRLLIFAGLYGTLQSIEAEGKLHPRILRTLEESITKIEQEV